MIVHWLKHALSKPADAMRMYEFACTNNSMFAHPDQTRWLLGVPLQNVYIRKILTHTSAIIRANVFFYLQSSAARSHNQIILKYTNMRLTYGSCYASHLPKTH